MSPESFDDEIDLIDYIAVIVRRRWLIFWTVVVSTAVSGLSTLMADPPPFRAEVNLLAVEAPPVAGGQESTINVNVLRGFGMGQYVLDATIPNPDDPSDSITVHQIIGPMKTVRQALEALNGKTDISNVDVGLVSIAVTDADSVAAAGIANAYVYGLKHYFVEERQRRADEEVRYIDNRLLEVEVKLRAAEDSLLAFRAEHRGRLDTEQYLMLQRELGWRQRRVSSWESVYNSLLSRQESIRIQAQRGTPEFEVISFASAEDAVKEGWSLRTRLILGIGAGAVLGIFLAFGAESVRRMGSTDNRKTLARAYRGE